VHPPAKSCFLRLFLTYHPSLISIPFHLMMAASDPLTPSPPYPFHPPSFPPTAPPPSGNGRRAAHHLLQWGEHQRCPAPLAFTQDIIDLFDATCDVFRPEGVDMDQVWGSTGKEDNSNLENQKISA
jgi:hypothetical protein